MYVLTLHCPDRSGIVADVATCLHDNGCNIEEAAQFNDPLSGHFFMRVAFAEVTDGAHKNFQSCFDAIGARYGMDWHVHNINRPIKMTIMASNHDHCLHDILYRHSMGRLNIDIQAIVSNHETCRSLADHHGIPYHYLPVTSDTKTAQEQMLRKIIGNTDSELIILARYMQVLSPDFCDEYAGRIINIHHSFLPGFKGARPYHQAHKRGVKIIGATAHYVTSDLDEGPIIEQETLRISHVHTPEAMQDMGRDIEARVLSRTINMAAYRRIFLHEGRTVIL